MEYDDDSILLYLISVVVGALTLRPEEGLSSTEKTFADDYPPGTTPRQLTNSNTTTISSPTIDQKS